uniref:Uncharacterized protein n=1 Tax=viral metagenome TaxID=1070528 RepID=A0A6C0DY52_9ZZZZ
MSDLLSSLRIGYDTVRFSKEFLELVGFTREEFLELVSKTEKQLKIREEKVIPEECTSSGVSAAAASVSPPEKPPCLCSSQDAEVVTKHGMVYCFIPPGICFIGEGCSLCKDHEVTMSMCTCSHNEEPGRYQSLQTLDSFMMQRKFLFPQTYIYAGMVIATRRPRQNPLWKGDVLFRGKWME